MTNELELVRDARPSVDGPHPALAREARSLLMIHIAATTNGVRRNRRRRMFVVAVAGIAVVCASGVFALSERDGATAWAAELVTVAQDSPRLLLTSPGWTVSRTDEFSAGQGEMTFVKETRTLDLSWHQGKTDGKYTAGANLKPVAVIPAAGASAQVFRYAGTDDFVAVWSSGGFSILARALSPDASSFESLLGALHPTDVDSWLSAMPASVVAPDSRPRVVATMLEGVPLPPGFDSGALTRGDAVRDNYALGAQVAGTVACAWIGRWLGAKQSGDVTTASQAVAALASSRHWGVLRKMEPEGGYPQTLWQYADAIAGDGSVVGGKHVTVAQSYRQALGCAS